MSTADIEEQIREIYDFNVSQSTISKITEKVNEDIVDGHNRPLESVYLIVWLESSLLFARSSVVSRNTITNLFKLSNSSSDK